MVIDSIQGIGTQWWFEFFDDNVVQDEVTTLIEKELARFEQLYSRFKTESWLSQLNVMRTAFIDSEAVRIIRLSQDLFESTAGYFNIMGGKVISDAGYDSDHSFQAKSTNSIFGNPVTDIEIKGSTIQLTGHATIDLGGIGKGFLIDLLAALFHKNSIHDFIINGGGDIFVTSQKGAPILLTLEHPLRPNTSIGKILLKDASLCGSSPYKRKWKHNDMEYSHILSPHLGTPVTTWATFTTARTTTLADAYATAITASQGDVPSLYSGLAKDHIEVLSISGEKYKKSGGFPELIIE